MKCTRRRHNGDPCQGQAVRGTDSCVLHAGRPKREHMARGAVVTELLQWGFPSDKLRDPGQTLLQLMTQSAIRCELYGRLLGAA